MKVQLGISSGFTIKRWAHPTDWVRLINEELGLDLVQFSFDQLDPRSTNGFINKYRDLVRNECDKYNVDLHSTFTGLSIYSHNLLYHPLQEGRSDGIDWFEKAFAVTEKLGCNATGGPFGGMDLSTFLNENNEKSIIQTNAEDSLINLLKKAQKYGIKDFYWEATPVEREGTITIEDTKAFIEKINDLAGEDAATFSLCFDVGHTTNPVLTKDDKNPYRWIESLHDHIQIIHLQQTDGRLDRHWSFTEQNNEIGTIDPNKLFEALEKTEKDQIVLLLEIGHPFEQEDTLVLKELKASVDYWKTAMSQKGYL
jgi:sugar phosphate isomerase/epimerase